MAGSLGLDIDISHESTAEAETLEHTLELALTQPLQKTRPASLAPTHDRSRIVDSLASDAAIDSYSAQTWSQVIPHGFEAASTRSAVPYDAHMLEVTRKLVQLQENYALGLCELLKYDEQLTAGGSSPPLAKQPPPGEKRPVGSGLQYVTAHCAWDALIAALHAHTRDVQACSAALCDGVVAPIKHAIRAERKPGRAMGRAEADGAQAHEAREAAAGAIAKYHLALHSLQRRGEDEVSVQLSETCEAVVLQVAARGAVDAVEQANELQRKYEASGCAALDALQAREEERLQSVEQSLNHLASSLAPLLPQHHAAALQAAAEGVCDKASIAQSRARGKELEKAQAGGPAKRMGAELYAAIVLYTGNAIYRALNLALRERHAQVPRLVRVRVRVSIRVRARGRANPNLTLAALCGCGCGCA